MSAITNCGILVVLVAALSGAVLYVSNTNYKALACPAIDDVPWNLSSSSSENMPPLLLQLDPCQVFSDSYETARDRFRTAARALPGATLSALSVPSSANSNDDHADSYTIDIAVLPGSFPGVVVHVSGTHGVEGYTGSAIQVAFLQALLQQQQQQSQPLCTIILVHAFNPVGMALFRRFNENNVDLNRNGLLPEEWATENRFWNTNAYDTFVPTFLDPALYSPYSWWNAVVLSWGRMFRAILGSGVLALKQVLVGGQYHRSNGIFYGGAHLEASHVLLRDWMATVLPDLLLMQPTTTTKKPVALTWIDVHTGLGSMGVDTLLASTLVNASDIRHWFPDAAWHDEAAVSQGYENTMGRSTDYYQMNFSLTNDLFFAQEFGTVHALLASRALILENAIHFDPTVSEADRRKLSKQLLGAAFYPANNSYRKSVLHRGLSCLQRAIQRSMALSSMSPPPPQSEPTSDTVTPERLVATEL